MKNILCGFNDPAPNRPILNFSTAPLRRFAPPLPKGVRLNLSQIYPHPRILPPSTKGTHMDWTLAIERNREVLMRIVLALFAMIAATRIGSAWLIDPLRDVLSLWFVKWDPA
jgi:hypothetical protein